MVNLLNVVIKDKKLVDVSNNLTVELSNIIINKFGENNKLKVTIEDIKDIVKIKIEQNSKLSFFQFSQYIRKFIELNLVIEPTIKEKILKIINDTNNSTELRDTFKNMIDLIEIKYILNLNTYFFDLSGSNLEYINLYIRHNRKKLEDKNNVLEKEILVLKFINESTNIKKIDDVEIFKNVLLEQIDNIIEKNEIPEKNTELFTKFSEYVWKKMEKKEKPYVQ